jgi:deoxyribodipyrimidine photo-lyase
MKQILWFRRDLRISDNAILANADSNGEILPLFIFDSNILEKLPKDDKRVTFIYYSVLKLKQELRAIGLDLAIIYGEPEKIFQLLESQYDEVLCSCDFDSYAIKRDLAVENIIPMKRYYDSYLLHPNDTLKKDGTPYKVFTPFYKNLEIIWGSDHIQEYHSNIHLKLVNYDFKKVPTLEEIGFEPQQLSNFLLENPFKIIEQFKEKLSNYQNDRDLFFKDGTSNISVHLRFGLISPKQIFNILKPLPQSNFFIRELFWREFYNTILFHFPKSEFENFNTLKIPWENNLSKYKAWRDGKTGVPIIDASMTYLNQTGLMPNRLRMIVASFLTKNLLIDWRFGEAYFKEKLLDYDASSNIGSWQWSGSTGADSVPYFRVFNPYLQSEKFDKEGKFIKSILPQFKSISPKELHKQNNQAIVDIKSSSKRAIEVFKNGKNRSS